MRLSRKSEYALLALIDLAERHGQAPTTSAEISKRRQIPKQYLDQLFLILKRAGYVRSMRGAAGGYTLAKSPDAVHLAELIRLMDGPLAPVDSASEYFYETSPIEQHPKLLKLFRKIRDQLAEILENTTLEDIR